MLYSLYDACEHGYERISQWLLSLVTDMNEHEKETVFAACCCASRAKGSTKRFNTFFKTVWNTFQPNNIAEGFLCACLTGHLDIIRFLLPLLPTRSRFTCIHDWPRNDRIDYLEHVAKKKYPHIGEKKLVSYHNQISDLYRSTNIMVA